VALPLLLLGLFLQATAPTAAYPVAVPLMLGGLAVAIKRRWPAAGTIAVVTAAMLGVGYMLGFGFFLLQAVGPKTPMIAAVPLAIGAVLILPLIPEVDRRRAGIASAVLIALALGTALWVLLDPIAPSVAAYSTDH
jgi:hypothetical protein